MPHSIIKLYYEGLEHGVLIAKRCSSCNHITFPPTTACERCGSFDQTELELSGKGKLQYLSHGAPSPRFAEIALYPHGHIVLEEGIVVQAIVLGVETDPGTVRDIYEGGPTPVVLDVLRTQDLPVMAFKLAE